jgi:hypothetical protein
MQGCAALGRQSSLGSGGFSGHCTLPSASLLTHDQPPSMHWQRIGMAVELMPASMPA